MTEHTEIEQIKDSHLYRKASQNVDSHIIEIVRLLARHAAENDLEKMQQQAEMKTLH